MLPLLDIVFLLLTFFIYSLAVMVEARVLPVQLTPVSGQTATGTRGPITVLTITEAGDYFLNRDPVAEGRLDERLRTLASELDNRTLFVALEGGGGAGAVTRVDRGPTLIRLWQRLQRAGIRDVAFVGPPSRGGLSGGDGDTEREANALNTRDAPDAPDAPNAPGARDASPPTGPRP